MKENWSAVPLIWRECFNEAWASFQAGSRPVGAVVVNGAGEIVARGKSTTLKELPDSVVSHNELAHAELNALLKLDNRVHQEVSNYILYSTLEPCPLCFSAFYMSGIRNLAYAVKDRYGGSTNLLSTTPYLSRKPIRAEGPVVQLEQLSILLNVYFDRMIGYGKGGAVHEEMAKDYPEAVQIPEAWLQAEKLHHSHDLYIADVYAMLLDESAVYGKVEG